MLFTLISFSSTLSGEIGADAAYDRLGSANPQLTALNHPRIVRRLADCSEASECGNRNLLRFSCGALTLSSRLPTLLRSSLIFLDIAPHTGVTEGVIVDALLAAVLVQEECLTSQIPPSHATAGFWGHRSDG